jgi:hypothetical protein
VKFGTHDEHDPVVQVFAALQDEPVEQVGFFVQVDVPEQAADAAVEKRTTERTHIAIRVFMFIIYSQ